MITNKDIRHGSNFWTNFFKTPTESEDLELLLKQIPTFEELKSKYIKQLVDLLHNREYQPNENIFLQNDPGIGLFIIREGEVKISHKDEDGNTYDLAVLTRGDFFGEMAMMEGDVRSASATAVKKSNLVAIFKPDLDEFIDQNLKAGITILKGFARILSTRLKKANEEYFNLFSEQNKGG